MSVRKLGGVKLNDELLINLVRKHPVLYDISHPKYLDNKVKDNIWNALGQELKTDGSTCKLRWNNIRDQYRKRLKDIVAKGGCSDKVKIYKYSEQMAFLTPFFKEKEIKGQIITTSEENTIDIKDSTYRVNESTQKGSASSVDPLQFVRASSPLSEQSQASSSSAESANTLPNLPNKATESLIEYLLKKHEAEVSPAHPIDTFLAALAPSLKSLNPYQQHLAKGELFAVVHKYEMEMLRENNQAHAHSPTNNANKKEEK